MVESGYVDLKIDSSKGRGVLKDTPEVFYNEFNITDRDDSISINLVNGSNGGSLKSYYVGTTREGRVATRLNMDDFKTLVEWVEKGDLVIYEINTNKIACNKVFEVFTEDDVTWEECYSVKLVAKDKETAIKLVRDLCLIEDKYQLEAKEIECYEGLVLGESNK